MYGEDQSKVYWNGLEIEHQENTSGSDLQRFHVAQNPLSRNGNRTHRKTHLEKECGAYAQKTEETQKNINNIFQTYKLGLITIDAEGHIEGKEFIPDFEEIIEIPVQTISKEKFNRAKEKIAARKKIEDGYSKWEEEKWKIY